MKRAYRSWALALLLVGGAAGLGYHHVRPDIAGDVWNASQAALNLLTLAMVAIAYPGWPRAVCALLASWQALAAGCSVAWIVKPWPVQPGQAQCSAALDLPITAVGAWLLVVIALRLDTEHSHGTPRT